MHYAFASKISSGPDAGTQYNGTLDLLGDTYGGLIGWLRLPGGVVDPVSGQQVNGNLNMLIIVRSGTPSLWWAPRRPTGIPATSPDRWPEITAHGPPVARRSSPSVFFPEVPLARMSQGHLSIWEPWRETPVARPQRKKRALHGLASSNLDEVLMTLWIAVLCVFINRTCLPHGVHMVQADGSLLRVCAPRQGSGWSYSRHITPRTAA